MTDTDISLGQRLPVEGTYNLRELGGYRAGDATVRWGKLYRSDALHALTPLGKKSVADLGIRLVIDLRSDDEVVTDRTALGAEVEIVRAPIFTSDAQAAPLDQAEITLARVYDVMVEQRGPQLTEAVRRIARSGEAPVLVHCTAGKDRTGLVIALALLAAGVDREEVVTDYAQTSANLAGPWAEQMIGKMTLAGIPLSPALEELVTASPREELTRLIERWESEWGSPLGYLEANGFTAEDRAALTAALLGR